MTAKEIWDQLLVSFEGTDGARETKINFLLWKHEPFKKKSDETIIQILTRFDDIVNGLVNQGTIVNESETLTTHTNQGGERDDRPFLISPSFAHNRMITRLAFIWACYSTLDLPLKRLINITCIPRR